MSLQSKENPLNYESSDFNTGLAQDAVCTVFDFVEGKVDYYYTETPVTFDSREGEDKDFHRIDVCDMVELQDLPCRIVEVDMQDFPPTSIGELELWELVEISDAPTSLTDRQILEEFMLEEETDFQGIDECKIVDVQDELEIKECIDGKIVGMPNIPVKVAYEQEECIKEEISDVLTPIHAEQEISLPNRTIDQSMTEWEMSILNQNIAGQLIPKLHTRHRKVSGSKLVRRVNPTRLVRRIIPSMCRPPPKPPDRQNSLNDKASNRVMPYMNPKRRPDIHYANEQRKSWDYIPLLSPLTYKMQMEKG